MFHECSGAQRREAGLMKGVTSQMTTDQTGGEPGPDLCVLHHLGADGPLLLTLSSDNMEQTV